MDGQEPCCRARRVPALFPDHGAGDDVWVIFPLVLGLLPAITAAASGWLYLYLAARTPRFGVPVLMNLVVLLLFLAAGELSGWMAVTLAAGAVLAELVRRLGGYESLRAAAGAFSRWPSAPAGVHSTFGSTRLGRQPAPRKRCPQPMPRRWRGLPRRGCWS